jgi:surface antigen
MWGYLSTGGADGNGGDGHGYGCRQCASFVAWKIAKETGKYYSWGNAVNFTQSAINAGYTAGGPQAGSIAVMDPGTAGVSEGHVGWVEAVSGNKVLISQYNYNYGAGYGMYSEMWLSSSAFDHYVHIE